MAGAPKLFSLKNPKYDPRFVYRSALKLGLTGLGIFGLASYVLHEFQKKYDQIDADEAKKEIEMFMQMRARQEEKAKEETKK